MILVSNYFLLAKLARQHEDKSAVNFTRILLNNLPPIVPTRESPPFKKGGRDC